MLKKIIISFLIMTILLTGSLLFSFIYFERTQKLIIHSLNLKETINHILEDYISNKLNDKNIRLKVANITFLEPEWPNLLRFELNDININTYDQKENSNIKLVELGFSYKDLVTNIFLKNKDLYINYIKLNDLTLNGKLEKGKFLPGPLLKILSLVNNDITNNNNFKHIWNNEMSVGNIKLLLLDKTNKLKERNFNIDCKNVYISRYINKSRSINMNCEDNNKVQFSFRGEFAEKYNKFNGDIKNINLGLLTDTLFDLDNINLIEKLSTNLNGSYNFITDKNLNLKSLNFFSKNSLISIIDTQKTKLVSKSKFNGEISWKPKEKLLNFKNISFAKKSIGSGSLDFLSQKGFVELKFKKLELKSIEKILATHQNYIKQFIDHTRIEYYLNSIKSGVFDEIVLNLNFSFIKKLKFIDIKGYSVFKNITVKHRNKFFQKFSSVLSGDFEFEVFFENNIIIDRYSWVKMNIDASKGALHLREPNFKYKFDQAKFKLKIIKDNFKISKAIFIRDKQIEYSFKDIIIINKIIKNGYLKINNNQFFSNIFKKKLNIDLVGDAEFNFSLQGNLKKLDFKFNLNSDLSDSFINSNLLNIRKNKNIPASIKLEIRFENGRLRKLKNFILQTNNNIYSIQSVSIKGNSFNEITLKNITARNLILNKVNISKVDGYINLLISGKKIDLSNLKNNIKNKLGIEKKIAFDITADKIIFDPEIVFSGNIKGNIKKSIFQSIAYGQMLLGGSPLLEFGKLNISINDKVSKLDGIGLTGGAETKLKLIKNNNSYPQLTFETSNGGKLLKALGFTKNIKSGDMKIEINFLNASYDKYEGIIDTENFSLINAPGFIKSLSILSFSGIQSIVTGEGVFFNKGQAKIFVDDNIFNFDKLYLSSESLGISARGKLNLKDQNIDLRGSVAPIKMISKIVSIVPAVGQLITGLKKQGLFAGQFKMTGPLEKPKINLNTLSFAPGILRNLFSEDWLDKNNFFVKNKAN
ncbi:AsmA-like C-terminal region-containing protein [Alphaproteobacteria bacterium]|nr:AsmA-like C-terminal region-containing protein [Alphaproteobacteria bacterium]